MICWTLLGAISLCGCTTTQTLSPEHFFFENDKDITVYARDGRIIKFKSGDYTVINAEHGILRGQGKLVVNNQTNESREFQCSIEFPEILKITHTEETALGKTATYIFLGTSAILFWLAFFPPSIAP